MKAIIVLLLIPQVLTEQFSDKILTEDPGIGSCEYGEEQELYVEDDALSTAGEAAVVNICRSLRTVGYSPIAVLLRDKETVLPAARKYLRDVMKCREVRSEFWIMKFNESDTTTILWKGVSSDDQGFDDVFKSKQSDVIAHLGYKKDNGGALFYSALKAMHLLPKRGSLLIFADGNLQDEDLSQLALQEARTKNIKVYSVWQGLYPTLYLEEKILREVSKRSGGKFFVGNTENKLSTLFRESYLKGDNNKTESVVVHLCNVNHRRMIMIPIDEGTKSIHVRIAGRVSKARVVSPSGYLVDLFDAADVGKFSRGSYTVKVCDVHEIELNTAQPTPTAVVGIWRLETDPFAQHYYNVTVSVENHLVLSTRLVNVKQSGTNGAQVSNKFLKLDLKGSYVKVNNVSVVDTSGSTLRQFRYEMGNNTINKGELNDEFRIQLVDIPAMESYLQVEGTDVTGNRFVRLSYVNKDDVEYVKNTLTIDVREDSQLMPRSDQESNIYLEVKNTKNQRIYVNFQCHDERSLLKWMRPLSAWLNPQQVLVVTVATYTKPQSGTGYNNLVTFTAYSGVEQFEKMIIMSVGEQTKYDVDAPRIWHKYTSDCLKVLFQDCQEGSWSIQVTTRDTDTGLLKVYSKPDGIYFPNGFITGATNDVIGYFSGSCCNPTIEITSIDRASNRKTYSADAYKNTLGPAGIAAIVFGVILVLAIIIVIVVVIWKYGCKCCKKKQSQSIDLPQAAYRAPTSTTGRF